MIFIKFHYFLLSQVYTGDKDYPCPFIGNESIANSAPLCSSLAGITGVINLPMDVQQILASATTSTYKSIHVTNKVIPPTLDTANLAIIDINPLSQGSCLLECTRDNVQLLVNSIFDLARKTDESGVFAVLPPSKSAIIPLPREKSLPKPKVKTTWERFAEKRGIKQTKKSKITYDEPSGEYVPTHGRNSAKNNSMNDWCREVPAGEDPFENQFDKPKEAVKKASGVKAVKKQNHPVRSGKKQIQKHKKK